MADQSQFEIVQVGGPEGNLAARDVACNPSTPYSPAASNLQIALNETAQFILALAGQPKFQGGLDFNAPIPTGPAYAIGDYYIFRDGGNRTVDPVDPDIKAGDWAIYTSTGWTVLNYSFLNVVAENIPYQIPNAVGQTESVAEALDTNAAAIAANADDIAANADAVAKVEFTEFDSIQDVRNKTGQPIVLEAPTDQAILSSNLRTLANAMPNDSFMAAVVGDQDSETYKITGLAYGTIQLWRVSPNRISGMFFTKESSKAYIVTFDTAATKDIEYKLIPSFDGGGTWLESQNFEKQVIVGENWSGSTNASLQVQNMNSGQAVPIIEALSANGTERWGVDNGGHTTQTGEADIGGAANVGGALTVTGKTYLNSSSELGENHNSGSIPTLLLQNNNTGSTSTTINCLNAGQTSSYFTVKGGGKVNILGADSNLYVENNTVIGNKLSATTVLVNNVPVTPNDYVKTDTDAFLRTDDISDGWAGISFPTGNNGFGTLRLSTVEQTYNDLWLNCYNSGGNATIKLRSSGWGSFSGGTNSDVAMSLSSTVGQLYEGTTYSSDTQPALTVQNTSTGYNAPAMQVKDHAGNNAMSISTKGHVHLNGEDCQLDIEGNIWNSGHTIHTTTLNCGTMNANLSQPANCDVTYDHSVGGTLTVAGNVVTGSTLTVDSVDIGAKITEYQTKITDLETRLAALEASAVTYSS